MEAAAESRWIILALAFLLPAASTWADSLTNHMNAVTVRVLCLPAEGEPESGSGFVVGGGSHVVTNWHVVSCTAESGQVGVLLDAGAGDAIEARVLAHDADKDLAVLRLERRIDRPAARFATFATLSQRDPVVAVGFPGDADEMGDLAALSTSTMTEGVIGRLLPPPADSTRAARLIQVSAAINPGNSGGPLFDAAGRVIGINTMKALAAVPTLSADGSGLTVQRVVAGEGLGWAVASDELLPLLDRLGLDYAVSSRRLGAIGLFWQRQSGLATTLVLLLIAALGGAGWIVALAVVHGSRASGPATQSQPEKSAPAQAQRPMLRGLSGPYAGATIPLDQGPVAIGRDPALARLVLPAHCMAISQRHALVTYQTGQAGFGLEDCWSTNGVFLMTGEGDGQRLRPGRTYPLAPGARFYLGTPEIAFRVDLETNA